MSKTRLFSTEEFVRVYMSVHKSGGTRMDVVLTLLGIEEATVENEHERSRYYNVVTQRIRSLNERLTSRGYPALPPLAQGVRGGRTNEAELENIASLIGEAEE